MDIGESDMINEFPIRDRYSYEARDTGMKLKLRRGDSEYEDCLGYLSDCASPVAVSTPVVGFRTASCC